MRKFSMLVLFSAFILAGCAGKKAEISVEVPAVVPAEVSAEVSLVTDNTMTDPRDGQKYRTVKIGDQKWMAENINYAAQNSLCNGGDDSNCEKYGRLYNWNTALTACPTGWHLPDTTDWSKLINAVGGHEVAGQRLKTKTGWQDIIIPPGIATDEFDFSALPGGNINGADGRTGAIGTFGFWWTSTPYDAENAWYRGMLWISDQVTNTHTEKHFLHSVRCISD